MAGEIKILEFAEGVTTTAPNQLAAYSTVSYVEKTSNYTILDDDKYSLIVASGSGTTITLPNTTNNVGRVISIKRNDSSNDIVIARNDSGDTIDGIASNLTIDQDLKTITLAFIESGKVVII